MPRVLPPLLLGRFMEPVRAWQLLVLNLAATIHGPPTPQRDLLRRDLRRSIPPNRALIVHALAARPSVQAYAEILIECIAIAYPIAVLIDMHQGDAEVHCDARLSTAAPIRTSTSRRLSRCVAREGSAGG